MIGIWCDVVEVRFVHGKTEKFSAATYLLERFERSYKLTCMESGWVWEWPKWSVEQISYHEATQD